MKPHPNQFTIGRLLVATVVGAVTVAIVSRFVLSDEDGAPRGMQIFFLILEATLWSVWYLVGPPWRALLRNDMTNQPTASPTSQMYERPTKRG